jgi:hypothetical protein
MKELLPTIRPWQDNNQERAARLTSTTHVILRIEVQVPSLIRDPTIAKDSKRTHATVSFSDLRGLQKNTLSNHIV